MERMTAFVKGNVQGVGFRWWTRSRALELGLAGHATSPTDACKLLPKAHGKIVKSCWSYSKSNHLAPTVQVM